MRQEDKYTVVVIDDDLVFRNWATKLLMSEFGEHIFIKSFANGMEFFASKEISPNVIVLDQNLSTPEMNFQDGLAILK